VAAPAGPARPHFFLGGPGRPVSLWHWQADRDQGAGRAVVKERAEGPSRPVQALPETAQDVAGRGTWKVGRWLVVLKRGLAPADPGSDVEFGPGRLIPFAVQAWDGDNGEQGLMMSLSSWHYLALEAPVPPAVYAWSLLGVALAGLAEWGLIRRERRRVEHRA
jgi:DMSO reductase family type II enzyme heme b subunit